MKRRSRRLRQAALAAAIMVVIAFSASPAMAGPGPVVSPGSDQGKSLISKVEDLYQATGMTPEVLTLMKTQEALDPLAADIRAQAKAAMTEGAGLSGIVVDPERNTLRLYWYGFVPSAVSQQISAARRTGITVTVQSAPYTAAQLREEVDRMSRLPLFTGSASGRRVMIAGPKPDGSGINVSISGLPAGTTVARARQLVPALNSQIPLTITLAPPPQFASRWYDFPPYWGGAYIQNPGVGLACTSGFGTTGNNGAATYMLTAAHCGEGEWQTGHVVVGGDEYYHILGNTIPGRDLAHDGEAILTPEGSDGVVYYGESINPPGSLGTSSGIAVGGASTDTIGDLVCTSGAFTGTVCGIRVAATGMSIRFDPPENGVGVMTNMVNAQLPGTAVAGEGDSGGPVFAIRTTDQRAIARGTMSAIDVGAYVVPCTGYAPPGRVCSMSVWYGEVTDIMNTIGVHINTS